MQNQKPKLTHPAKKQSPHHKESSFSPATIKVAELMLKKFEEQADEAFLIRAKMDRELSSW
jgi:hypothetical protein